MRLQLTRDGGRAAVLGLAVLAGVLAAGAARAEESFVAKTQVYTDSDHTTVVSPLVHATKEPWSGATLGVGVVADVVSAASVDVVTNATPHMSDFRKELSSSLAQVIRDTTLSAGYIYSAENDYQSHNISLGFAQDLLQRNTTLAAGYAVSLNDVGRSGDPNFHRALTVHTVDASWTQVLSPTQVLQLGYTYSYSTGFQASPYRFVCVGNTDPSVPGSCDGYKVPETDPDVRNRNAIVAAWKKHVGTDSSIQLDYRLYFDDWGIVSHTAEFAYFVNFSSVSLRLRERVYYQGSASFFQPHYDALQPFMATDRELSTFWSTMTGGKLVIHIDAVTGLDLEAKVDVFYFEYLNYAFLDHRVAANFDLGLTLRY
jgi:hypothetical protein